MGEPEFKRGDRVTVTASRSGVPAVGATGTVRSWNPQRVLRQLEVDWDQPALTPTSLLDLAQGGVSVVLGTP